MEEEEEKTQEKQPTFINGSSTVKKSIELTSSLISLSHSTKVFSVKWQTIRKRLDELNSGLIAIDNCHSSCFDSVSLSNLISNVNLVIEECFDLAKRCIDLSYSGKLLMQSDLDLISNKIAEKVKTVSEIYSVGVLTHGFAIIVSKPGLNNCKEDMKFYVTDLLTRLKIGDTLMKRQALMNLYEAITEDDKYVKLISEIDDLLFVLVSFLDSIDVESQQESAKILCLISGFDVYKCVLIQSGVIGPLIRVLESGNELGKEMSANCLMKLTSNSDNAWSVSAHGGVTALLSICSKSSEFHGELIGFCCGVLKNLIGVDEIKRFVIEEGGISTFINLIRSKHEIVQVNSIEFLQNVAESDESVRQLVVEKGGIRVMNRVLEPRSSSSSKTKEITLRAIENLCFGSVRNVHTLMSYSFLDHLLFLIKEVSIQESALKVVCKLSSSSEEAKRTMGDSGFMLELVKFLDSKPFEIRELASQALYFLTLVPRNRKRFAQDDRNIECVLRLLDQEERNDSGNSNSNNNNNKKFLISILVSLSNCSSAKRKIVSSGYLKCIEKLAEAEVFDAKKLVKKLSTNRLRSMLNGIWHS